MSKLKLSNSSKNYCKELFIHQSENKVLIGKAFVFSRCSLIIIFYSFSYILI
jgi:hypothetical protein